MLIVEEAEGCDVCLFSRQRPLFLQVAVRSSLVVNNDDLKGGVMLAM
jgi:hypothetical protein